MRIGSVVPMLQRIVSALGLGLACMLLLAAHGCGNDRSRAQSAPADRASRVTTHATPRITLRRLSRSFAEPVYVTAPSGSTKLYVVERAGRVLVRSGGRWQTFLDIRGRVGAGGSEQGLLSIAFHPDFASNRRFFADYTDSSGDTRIVEFAARPGAVSASPSSQRVLLRIDQPYENHNGGLVLFGPDGHLYIGMGDGGSGGDPENRAQNPRSLLGKLLRIDIDGGRPYGIPPGNPFADGAGGKREIFVFGLRNPWRFAFDPPAGTMYVADVGQDAWEEVDVVKRSGSEGWNFGWDAFEGTHRFEQKTVRGHLVRPLLQYPHGEQSAAGCSITGGSVYRGSKVPALRGWYLYADFCRSWIKGIRVSGGRIVQRASFAGTDQISSFGVDGAGEHYVASLSGSVFRIVRG